MRKIETLTIEDQESRDFGKQYLLTEMDSHKAEKWALKAFDVLLSSGIQIPDTSVQGGLASLISYAVKGFSGLPWERLEPLLDEMFKCVSIIPNPSNPGIFRPINESTYDIEEVSTRLKIRWKLIEMHVGFLKAVAPSTSAPSAAPEKI